VVAAAPVEPRLSPALNSVSTQVGKIMGSVHCESGITVTSMQGGMQKTFTGDIIGATSVMNVHSLVSEFGRVFHPAVGAAPVGGRLSHACISTSTQYGMVTETIMDLGHGQFVFRWTPMQGDMRKVFMEIIIGAGAAANIVPVDSSPKTNVARLLFAV
jgi:hypothetical protein